MSASQTPQAFGGQPPDAGTVSNELEQIFVAATGVASSHAARTPPGRSVRHPLNAGERRRRVPTTALGAVAAMVLAGASAFAVAYTAPSSSPLAEPAPAADAPRRTVSIVTGLAPPSTRAPTAQAEAATTTPAAQAAPRAHRVELAAVTHRRRAGKGDLIAADRQLRRAYARAVSAGVPRPILVDYRNRWADLRHEAAWRPDRVAVGYRAMAGDLTRMAEPPRRYGRRETYREARAW